MLDAHVKEKKIMWSKSGRESAKREAYLYKTLEKAATDEKKEERNREKLGRNEEKTWKLHAQHKSYEAEQGLCDRDLEDIQSTTRKVAGAKKRKQQDCGSSWKVTIHEEVLPRSEERANCGVLMNQRTQGQNHGNLKKFLQHGQHGQVGENTRRQVLPHAWEHVRPLAKWRK